MLDIGFRQDALPATADRGGEPAERLQLRAAQGGDGDAFAALCRRHAPALYRFAARLLGDAAEAEDVVQDVMLALWQQLDRFDPTRASLSTWLHRCVHNASIDRLRRRARHVPVDADTTAVSPADLSEAERRARTVQAALDGLPERERTALILCHYQRLNQTEAAAVLDTSVSALESLLARARRRLRRTLARDGLLEAR